MKPAIAKATDNNALEDLGRATRQIVHDLKNQLNGLKLYATFLRKRLEREDRLVEERETLAKLIAGLDRAARDMTALVRYSQPLELRRQPRTDLRKILSSAIMGTPRETGGAGRAPLTSQVECGPLCGEFDPAVLSEALKAITDEAVSSVSSRNESDVSLRVTRQTTATSPEALLEWRGVNLGGRTHPFRSSDSHGTVHTALAGKVIEAHGGRFKCDANIIRAWLPLSG